MYVYNTEILAEFKNQANSTDMKILDKNGQDIPALSTEPTDTFDECVLKCQLYTGKECRLANWNENTMDCELMSYQEDYIKINIPGFHAWGK